MSVIYDQLKQVEDIQPEDTQSEQTQPEQAQSEHVQPEQAQVKLLPKPKAEEPEPATGETKTEEGETELEGGESLPLDEEIQYQRQKKWKKFTSPMVIAVGTVLLLLGSIPFFIFVNEGRYRFVKSEKVPSLDYMLREQSASQVQLIPPGTEQPQEEILESTLAMKKAYKVSPSQTTMSKTVPEHKGQGKEPAVAVTKAKPVDEVEAVYGAKSVYGVKLTVPKNRVVKSAKVSPEMLAKKRKLLPQVQAGQQFYQAGALDKAIQAYKGAAKDAPQQLEVYNNLGVIYTRKGWLKKAAEEFKQALKANPYYAEAHYNMGVLLEKKGDNKKALRHYLKFIEYARPKHQETVDKLQEHIAFD